MGTRILLTMTMTVAPLMSSSFMYLTKPEHTVRGSASPISICSTYRDSASGCLCTTGSQFRHQRLESQLTVKDFANPHINHARHRRQDFGLGRLLLCRLVLLLFLAFLSLASFLALWSSYDGFLDGFNC